MELVMSTDSLKILITPHMPTDRFSPFEGVERPSEEREVKLAEFRQALLVAIKNALLQQLDEESSQSVSKRADAIKRNEAEDAQFIVPELSLEDYDTFHPRISYKFVLRHVAEDGEKSDFQVKESDRIWDQLSSEHPDASRAYKSMLLTELLSQIEGKAKYEQEHIAGLENRKRTVGDSMSLDRAISNHSSVLRRLKTFKRLVRMELLHISTSDDPPSN